MASVIWTEPAILDLEEITEFISYENPEAASRVSQRVLRHVRHLAKFPRLGPVIHEQPESQYRQIVESPCRVIYRVDDADVVYILHVIRFERLLRLSNLERGD